MLVLATTVATLGASAAGARGSANACRNAGVSAALARKAYGASATISPLTEPGNPPAALGDVPVCFVSAHQGTTVATVRLYAAGSWSNLIAIYEGTSPKPKSVSVNRLGAGAALYDVFARPGNYEEDLVFKVRNGVVTVRSRVLPFEDPPGTPLSGLATLARGIYAQQPSSR